jgi:hypothetical protein
MAGTYAIFGQGEWQTRLPTALFTLACSAMLFILLRNRGRTRAGLIAAALFAAMPITIYFGGHPDVINPQLIFFVLLTLAAYQAFHAEQTVKRLLMLCGAFALAGLTDWPAFFLAPVVCLHFAATRPTKSWLWIIGFGPGGFHFDFGDGFIERHVRFPMRVETRSEDSFLLAGEVYEEYRASRPNTVPLRSHERLSELQGCDDAGSIVGRAVKYLVSF